MQAELFKVPVTAAQFDLYDRPKRTGSLATRDWQRALRERCLGWLRKKGKGTSREMAHWFALKPDTISARLWELEREGRIRRAGFVGCGPGRPAILWEPA